MPLERSFAPCNAVPQKIANAIAIATVPIEAKKLWNSEAKKAGNGLQRGNDHHQYDLHQRLVARDDVPRLGTHQPIHANEDGQITNHD